MEENHPFFEKSMGTTSPGSPQRVDLLHFPTLLMRRPMYFPCDKAYHRVGIWYNKSMYTLGKLRVPFLQDFYIGWVLLPFLMM